MGSAVLGLVLWFILGSMLTGIIWVGGVFIAGLVDKLWVITVAAIVAITWEIIVLYNVVMQIIKIIELITA